MDDDTGAFGAGMMFMLVVAFAGHQCDLHVRRDRFAAEACELSCKRNRAGNAHAADESFCTCTNGLALKRDRSRLYVPVTATNTKGSTP